MLQKQQSLEGQIDKLRGPDPARGHTPCAGTL